MSSIASWSYTSTLTVWPASSFDKYGQPTFGSPYTITGLWATGGDVETDENGDEFVAASKYYFEMAEGDAQLPSRGDYIMKGDQTGNSDPIDAGAEKIKKIEGDDMTMFGSSEIPDWVVMT